MANSSASESRLLGPWALIVAAVAALGLLALTFKGEDVFMPDGKQPDAVSANYAELLLQAHPENNELRIRLIELLIKLGDFVKARHYLAEVKSGELPGMPFYDVELDVLEALAEPAGIPAERTHALVERLGALDKDSLPTPLLSRLAEHALALNAPLVAAQTYAKLAAREPEQRGKWLEEAARWYLAAGHPEQAAPLYLDLAELPGQEALRREHLEQAFKSLLAADHAGQAAELLALHLQELADNPADIAWLESGVHAAQGALRFDLATAFLDRWLSLRPGDPAALNLDFHLQLASGNIERAWAIGRQLLPLRPQDPELLRDMAQLSEWTGRPQSALEYWTTLLQLGEDPALREHAWRLASMMFDFEHSIPLLAQISQQRRMTDVELDALIYAHESRGTPEQAERWLRTYLLSYPQHLLAWQRLQQNLENTQQLQAETRVWAQMAARHPLTLAQRLDWAENHWNLFDPQSAWNVLTAIDSKAVTSVEYWRLRGALAWELELDDEVQIAFEQILALKQPLLAAEEDQLIALYRVQQPEKALALMVDNWQRTRNVRKLVNALQLAEQLQDWTVIRSLLADAATVPATGNEPDVLAARGALADHDGDFEQAERLYRTGLARFPRDNLFRERLLWFYVSHGRREELPVLLQTWRQSARADSRFWLPFASANLLLNRGEEALRWYRLYLAANPQDWLVQAAYADALEVSGREDSALRLRRYLMPKIKNGLAAGGPEQYATYLRLLAGMRSPLYARQQAELTRGQSGAMLQVWFDQLVEHLGATNQDGLKNEWLAWARGRGLKVSQYEQLQDALRQNNRSTLQQLLASEQLDAAQRVEVLSRLGHRGEAMGEGLSAVGGEQPLAIQQQLLRQTVEMHQRTPQGIQLGWVRNDYGGLDFAGPHMEVARYLGDDWYADLNLGQGRYSARSLDSSVLGIERNARLLLQRELADGSVGLTLDSSLRDDKDRHGLGLTRTWQVTSRDELEVGLDWHRETEETGLMRALGMRDGVSIAGRHAITARDQLSWSLAHRRFSTRQGDSLGKGEALNVELTHALFFEGPTWLVRSGVDYQTNRLSGALPESLLASRVVVNNNGDDFIEPLGGPLRIEEAQASDLLQRRYGQVYVGTTLRRGFPGALNREKPQYTWLVDLLAGWQWTESTLNYGLNVGVGMEVLGDDELAFTLGYQSAPQGGDGEAGGGLGVTYSARFGR